MSHRKKLKGNGCIFNDTAKEEKGIKIPISMIKEVNATTGAVAQLCINGTFLVRIMWMISVCDNKLSMNQPV